MGEHILEQLHYPDDGTLLWQASSTVSEFSSSPSGNADLFVVGKQGRDGAGMMVVKAGAIAFDDTFSTETIG